MKFWTEEKKEELKFLLQTQTPEYCAIRFNTSRKGIIVQAQRLGISLNLHKRITVNCAFCNEKIECLKTENKKFCNSSCSARHNNRIKSKETKEKQKISLLKTLQSKPKVTKLKKGYIRKLIFCSFCKKELGFTLKRICDDCKHKYYTLYKAETRFKFSIKDYSFIFSKESVQNLKNLGLYSASNRGNNLGGVSRDHKYSVKQGFINKIPSYILSHPANCELMLHSLNSSKNKKCSISLIELKHRILEVENIKPYLTKEQMSSMIEGID